MDPTDMDQETATLQKALSAQGSLLGHDDKILRSLADSDQTLVNQLSHLTHQESILTFQLTPPAPATQPIHPAPSAPPTRSPPTLRIRSTGDLDKCRGFLLQCSMVISQWPLAFPSDQSKVHYVMGLLRGRALLWPEAVNTNQCVTSLSYAGCVEKMKGVFDHPDLEYG